MEALEEGDIEAEDMIDMDPDHLFVPNKKAKHKVPQVFSSSNPTQKRKDKGQQKIHQRRPVLKSIQVRRVMRTLNSTQMYVKELKRINCKGTHHI